MSKVSHEFCRSVIGDHIRRLMSLQAANRAGLIPDDQLVPKMDEADDNWFAIERLIAAEVRKARIEAMEEACRVVDSVFISVSVRTKYNDVMERMLAAERAKEAT